MGMRFKTLAAALALLFATSACAYHDQGRKETIGTLGGAAAGGLLGSQIGSGTGQLVATGAGVIIGALVGGSIGRGLDDVDRVKARRAEKAAHSAPIGETITWNNPESRNSGSVTPVRDGTSSSGRYCREYQETVTIGGRTEEAYGTACRQPDGSWQMIN